MRLRKNAQLNNRMMLGVLTPAKDSSGQVVYEGTFQLHRDDAEADKMETNYHLSNTKTVLSESQYQKFGDIQDRFDLPNGVSLVCFQANLVPSDDGYAVDLDSVSSFSEPHLVMGENEARPFSSSFSAAAYDFISNEADASFHRFLYEGNSPEAYRYEDGNPFARNEALHEMGLYFELFRGGYSDEAGNLVMKRDSDKNFNFDRTALSLPNGWLSMRDRVAGIDAKFVAFGRKSNVLSEWLARDKEQGHFGKDGKTAIDGSPVRDFIADKEPAVKYDFTKNSMSGELSDARKSAIAERNARIKTNVLFSMDDEPQADDDTQYE